MTREDFSELIRKTFDQITWIEGAKRQEYVHENDQDRLSHFKNLGRLLGCSPPLALAGLMGKHTLSIYDMLQNANIATITIEQWDEKIIDHIVYLLLLKGLIHERMEDECKKLSPTRVDCGPAYAKTGSPVAKGLRNDDEKESFRPLSFREIDTIPD